MRLLIKALFRCKRHISLFVFSFCALIALTIATQLEMVTFGVITSNGADFFKLFSKEQNSGAVSYDEMQSTWHQIDKKGTGAITQQDANAYLAKHPKAKLHDQIMYKIKTKLNLSTDNFKIFIIFLLLVAFYKALCLFASRYLTQLLSIRISQDLRQSYFEHIQSLPMSFYQKFNIGTLSSRVAGDANQISLSINSFITNYLHAPFQIITSLGTCFFLSWQLSLVIFFGIPMIILPLILLTRKVKKFTRQLQRNQEKFTSVLIDFLAGILTVKIFAMEDFSLRKYKEQNDRMAHLEKKTAKYDLLTRPVLHTITTICLATVFVFGLHTLNMSISQLIVFCGFLHVFYLPVRKFAEENANIQKGVVAAERLYEVLDLKPQIEDYPGAIDLKSFTKNIEFENVWFRYEDRWILKDLSFSVEKGKTLAIVGATGAGKSTIVQLFPRLYDVQKGEIRIDGLPLKSYTQKSLREQIAFVSQKPFLFIDTISANIACGRPMPFEKILHAAKKAHADEFIEILPESYDAMLAEMGKNFSGGQQQRLAIARALAKEAPILVLDEATSSLDSISEKRIKQAIDGLHGTLTQVIIAHRLTTIENADKILFLEDGVKLAEGTKEELIKTCTPFRLMWETHFLKEATLLA